MEGTDKRTYVFIGSFFTLILKQQLIVFAGSKTYKIREKTLAFS
jgi:hypothetical protein